MLKIAIVTSGRFHVCDLARELSLLGHEVKFYSLVPPWRTKAFGLPSECNRWMLPRVGFRAASLKFARNEKAREQAMQNLVVAFDEAVSSTIERCDVLIGMSGMCNKLGKTVKERFGAQVWIERGSRHILSQKEILAAIPGASQVSDFAVQRELADYRLADFISVLSKHCEESFLERGFLPAGIVRSPLGVNLETFCPTLAPNQIPPTIVMAGTWSLQKGCDTLVEAWRTLPDTKLVHVGPVGTDFELPTDLHFLHYDKVDQRQLIKFYSQAHVFALASRQEGLATVQPQALACGLRLVCTNRTGGEDLREVLNDKSAISVVPVNDSKAFANALSAALAESTVMNGVRDLLSAEGRRFLSWTGYGLRYSHALASRNSA